MEDLFALGALFAIAFVAATILPAQSEAALAALQLAGYPAVLLVALSSAEAEMGNQRRSR